MGGNLISCFKMWKVFSGEILGRGHKTSPCQDKTFSVVDRGAFYVGLADGAGSAKFSDVGAESALKTAKDFFSASFDSIFNDENAERIKKSLLERILNELNKEARLRKSELREFASTLLFVACQSDKLIIVHIGDGMIILQRSGKLSVVSRGINGEFANTTYFTTSPNVEEKMFLGKGFLRDIDGFFLSSDGGEFSLYDRRRGTIASIVGKMLSWGAVMSTSFIDAKVDFLLRALKSKTFDDCSVLGISAKKEFEALDPEKRIKLLGLKGRFRTTKRLVFFTELVKSLRRKETLKQIAAKMRIKEKYLKKRISKIKELGIDLD